MSIAKKYVKKPVVINAVQFDVKALHTIKLEQILDWVGMDARLVNQGEDHYARYPEEYVEDGVDVKEDAPAYISIMTREGVMRADLGDWIIKGVQGEFYPCKPDIFEASYTNQLPKE